MVVAVQNWNQYLENLQHYLTFLKKKHQNMALFELHMAKVGHLQKKLSGKHLRK